MALPSRVLQQQAETDALDAAIQQELAPVTAAPLQTAPDAGINTPVVPQAPPVETQDEGFKAKYSTLKGMYDAEVPRMHGELRELRAQLAVLTAKPATPVTTIPMAEVTSQDAETFGEDLLDVIKRQSVVAAAERMGPELERLRVENEQLKAQMAGVTERVGTTDQTAYYTALTVTVPDWETLNHDPGFLAWLAEVDPLSGVAKQAYLNDAFENRDVNRTTNLFNAYRTLPPVPPAVPAPHLVNPELARLTTPDTSRASPLEPSTYNGPDITMAQVTRFYADVRRGAYKGRDAEMAREEATIDAAVTAGRIRP